MTGDDYNRRMAQDWAGVRHLLPAMEVVNESFPEAESVCLALFKLGWLTGHLSGYADGLKITLAPDLTQKEGTN